MQIQGLYLSGIEFSRLDLDGLGFSGLPEAPRTVEVMLSRTRELDFHGFQSL